MLFLAPAVLISCHTLLPVLGVHQDPLLRICLLLLAAAVTCGWLLQALPAENVLLAGTVAILISAAATVLMERAELPLHNQAGMKPLGTSIWSTLILWPIVALNARGVARVFLRRFRSHHYYGFWLVALAAFLSIPFFWLWRSAFGLSAPPLPESTKALLGEAAQLMLVSLTISVFITPALINKRPGPQPRPSIQPLFVSAVLTLVAFLG